MLKRLCVFVVLAVAVLLAAAPAAQAEHVFIFFLTGDQETPAVPTGAFGYGVAVMEVSDDAIAVMFGLSYGGLEGGNVSAAHFHQAPFGIAGGVRRTFSPPDFGSPDGYVVGTWLSTDREALTAELALEMFAGNIYFNIHTQRFGGGEVRGQLIYVFSY